MTIYKTIRLFLIFYGNFSLAANILNLCFAIAYHNSGNDGLGLIVSFKLTTLALIVVLIHSLRQNEYYYYRNLGLTFQWLWGVTILFDLAVFSTCLIIANQLR